MKRFRIAFLTSHPIQYQAPLFRELAQHPEIDLTVYFCWDFGVGKKSYDKEFGKEIQWDIPLLEDYRYLFLKNYSPRSGNSFFGHINIGIVKELYCNNYDAVVIVGWNSFTNILAVFSAKIFGITSLLRGDSSSVIDEKNSSAKRAIKKIILPIFFGLIDCILTTGVHNKKFYELYGVPKSKMSFCPLAIDNERFASYRYSNEEERKAARTKLGIFQDAVVILYVGKLIAQKKRPFDLLRAFEKLESIDNKALVFVGDGALKAPLQKYASEKKIDGVYFPGFQNQSEIGLYYAIADIFVIPSDGEPWGLVVNEALACGLPVVASNTVGCVPDLVLHGVNGLVYPCGDIAALTGCLNTLNTQRELRVLFGKKSSEIIQNYSYQVDIDAIRNVL